MRSAIRGDFERLAERRGGQELMTVDEEPPAPDVAEPTPEPESVLEPELEAASELEPETEAATEPERPPEPEPEPELEPEPAADDTRTSWLDRLLGR